MGGTGAVTALSRIAALAAAAASLAGVIVLASAPGHAADAPLAGRALYDQKCAECHGADLAGEEHGPPLVGPEFWDHWKGKPARELYRLIYSAMPYNEPGTLEPAEAVTMVDFLASANGHALPRQPTKPDDLDAMTLSKP